MPGLGLSDHVVLQFTLACYTERVTPPDKSFNYHRGDYDLLRELLQDVDWSCMLEMDVQHTYNFFVSSIRDAVAAAVPLTHPKTAKNLYINKQALKLKREKSVLWHTYTQTRDELDYARYCRSRNKLRRLTRNLRKSFEHGISKDVKCNPKAFWRYCNSRLKTKAGIGNLRMRLVTW